MNTNEMKDPRAGKPAGDGGLAEDVLRQAGKSEDEIARMGKVDRADDQVDNLFPPQHRTANSPVHKAVWDKTCPVDLFKPALPDAADPAFDVQRRCLEVVQRHRAAGTLYDANKKVSDAVMQDLAKAGYWGMLIAKEYGGQGASIRSFMTFLTRMSATADPTTAGLASIHGCIGAVDPLCAFGSDEQKKYFLPLLASGKKTSGFALTEPNAGSDLTALRTTAILDGEDFVVNGEKLFISNAIQGRIVGLVVMTPAREKDGTPCVEKDDKPLLNEEGKPVFVPAVLVVELPACESPEFQIVNYGLHALTHTYNNGLKFVNFRVPKRNLLKAEMKGVVVGDGLTIAYHGLNRGRVALCANAAGVMRLILRSITPESWGKFRHTYGESIEKRELVKARMATAAARIVGADALVAWCASLLDEGYRGELECVIAKVFGSEAQWYVATEVGLKTHGGRAFLHGHLIGDNIHDYAAPMIYEGEGRMLSMALFKTLAKEHGLGYMLPTGNAMNGMLKGAKKMQLGSAFVNLFKFGYHGMRYSCWQLGKRLPWLSHGVSNMDKRLARHLKFAQKMFHKLPLELSAAMIKHQLKLADRQCRIAYLSQRVQDTVTMLVTALYAHQVGDEATVAAADVLCQELTMKLTGAQPTDEYFKACSKLGDMIIEGRFKQLEGVPETPIVRPYKQ